MKCYRCEEEILPQHKVGMKHFCSFGHSTYEYYHADGCYTAQIKKEENQC